MAVVAPVATIRIDKQEEAQEKAEGRYLEGFRVECLSDGSYIFTEDLSPGNADAMSH